MEASASSTSSDRALATAFVVAALTAVAVFVYDKFLKLKTKPPRAPTVRQLCIYPIKSCAEVTLPNASVTPRGFRHDRVFQVVARAEGDEAWTFCTPRNRAFEKLFHLRPRISADGKCLTLSSSQSKSDSFSLTLDGAAKSSLTSKVMGYNEFSLDDYGDDVAAWIGRATGIDAPRLVGIPTTNSDYDRHVKVNPDQGEGLPSEATPASLSLADEAPFLLTTRESLETLNRRLASAGKEAVDMRRFRPNIVIDGLRPWEEDTLKRIRVGSAEFHVWQRCGRCTMTTVDRDTLRRCGEPLATLGTFRERAHGQRNFGMHLIPAEGEGGEIAVGDAVEVLEYDEERREEWLRLFHNDSDDRAKTSIFSLGWSKPLAGPHH